MKPIDLDPGPYVGSYKLVGGRVSLDFANTLAWRGNPKEHDWLDRWTNVVDWSVAVGIVRGSDRGLWLRKHRRKATEALRTVGATRSVIYEVMAPLVDGGAAERGAVDGLNEFLSVALRNRFVSGEKLCWEWRSPETVDQMLAPVVYDCADLIVAGDRRRLRKCRTCGWMFYDTSRGRGRKWCDMGDCGSRDKALKYYHRNRRR